MAEKLKLQQSFCGNFTLRQTSPVVARLADHRTRSANFGTISCAARPARWPFPTTTWLACRRCRVLASDAVAAAAAATVIIMGVMAALA